MKLSSIVAVAILVTACYREEPVPQKEPMNRGEALEDSKETSRDIARILLRVDTMMTRHLEERDRYYDLRFIDMMINHHECGIMAAKSAIQYAVHPESITFAEDMALMFQMNIDQMKEWRKKWYDEERPAKGTYADSLLNVMTEMDTTMAFKLGTKDPNYDLRFTDMMLIHHRIGIDMAIDALEKTSHPKMRELAEELAINLRRGMKELQAWRVKWYG